MEKTENKGEVTKLLLLNNIGRPDYVKDIKRVARGAGEHGCKSGRGNKGQKSRAGGANPKTEGGQFKSYLRERKRGFTRRAVEIKVIKTSMVETLCSLIGTQSVSLDQIKKHMKWGKFAKVKLLFDKCPTQKLTVEVNAASESARKVVSINLVKTKPS